MSNAFDDLPTLSEAADPATGQATNAFDDISPPVVVKPRDKQPTAKYSPLDGMNWAERALAGAGGELKHTLIDGPQQAYYRATGNDPAADAIGRQVANERETEAPLMQDRAGAAGSFVGATAPLLAGPEGWLAGAGFNAAAGALQPVSDGDSRLVNALTGAAGSAAGSAVGKGLNLVAQPVKNALTDTGKAAVQKLIDAGVPLDVAQRTGSEFLQRMKSGLSSLPVTAGWVKDSAADQKRAFTVAALKTIGSDGDRASPSVMADAKSAIGDVFDQSAARGAHYDPQLENDLQGVQSSLTRTVPASNHGPINVQIQDILDNAANNNGRIDGSVLQRVHSDLGNLSRNPDVGGVASQMRSALVSAQARASTPEEAAALAKARTQYRNLKQIEPAIRDEEIAPSSLVSVQRQAKNRSQSVYGTGDQELPELARAGASVLPQTVGSSGTAERHGALATIGAGGAIAAPLIFGAGHALMSGEPMDSEHWSNAGKCERRGGRCATRRQGVRRACSPAPPCRITWCTGLVARPTQGLRLERCERRWRRRPSISCSSTRCVAPAQPSYVPPSSYQQPAVQ